MVTFRSNNNRRPPFRSNNNRRPPFRRGEEGSKFSTGTTEAKKNNDEINVDDNVKNEEAKEIDKNEGIEVKAAVAK